MTAPAWTPEAARLLVEDHQRMVAGHYPGFPWTEFAGKAAAELDAALAEIARFKKLFDDAGQGEHNVLALIDYYQGLELASHKRAEELKGADDHIAECQAALVNAGVQPGGDGSVVHGIGRLAERIAELEQAPVDLGGWSDLEKAKGRIAEIEQALRESAGHCATGCDRCNAVLDAARAGTARVETALCDLGSEYTSPAGLQERVLEVVEDDLRDIGWHTSHPSEAVEGAMQRYRDVRDGKVEPSDCSELDRELEKAFSGDAADRVDIMHPAGRCTCGGGGGGDCAWCVDVRRRGG